MAGQEMKTSELANSSLTEMQNLASLLHKTIIKGEKTATL